MNLDFQTKKFVWEKLMKVIGLIAIICLTQSCAMLFPSRSFQEEMDRESDGLWIPGQDFEVTAGDAGEVYRDRNEIMKRTPTTAYEAKMMKEEVALRSELSRHENRLSERQYKQYLQDRDALESTTEKIYYLRLPASERSTYMDTKRNSYVGSTDSYSYAGRKPAAIPSAYDSYNPVNIWNIDKEIHQGMSKQQVRVLLGGPDRVDVAGNPSYENERWIYRSSGKVNYVYFEGGQVSGWVLN